MGRALMLTNVMLRTAAWPHANACESNIECSDNNITITSNDIVLWNNNENWGNHALVQR